MYGSADLDQGSFASHAVWREAFLFKLPDELSDEDCAPMYVMTYTFVFLYAFYHLLFSFLSPDVLVSMRRLANRTPQYRMCGGATVWNALTAYDARPTETVGVVGVGGLGHLAIQFAAKFGCRVVVFSGTDSKKEEALRLGAHEFIATKGQTELKVSQKLDRLLVTTSAQPDWKLYMSVMNPGSVIHPLSVSSGDFSIPYGPLIGQGITVQGSVVAPRQIHKDMLKFAALHQIKPVIQEFPLSEAGIKDAMDKLEKGEVHFRAVLKPQ